MPEIGGVKRWFGTGRNRPMLKINQNLPSQNVPFFIATRKVRKSKQYFRFLLCGNLLRNWIRKLAEGL